MRIPPLPRAHGLRLSVPVLSWSCKAVAVYACVCLAVFLGQRWLLYPRYLVPDWQGWSWPLIERVTVETADGERLKGFWKQPAPEAGVVITFHGNGSLPEPNAERFASAPWATRGWGVLAVAYRGYPGSTGSPDEAGLLADGEAAYAYAQRRVPGVPVLFHGHSLGTGVAVAMAARHPSKGLYLEAAYPSLEAVAHSVYPFLPTFLLLDTMHSDRRIPGVRSPALLVHGHEDTVIPPAFGRALAAAAGTGAAFVEITADHMSVFGLEDVRAEALFRDAPVVGPSLP